MVSVDRDRGLAVKVDYATSGGTATAGDDYTVTSGTLAFGPDTARTRTVRVPTIDDSVEDTGRPCTWF